MYHIKEAAQLTGVSIKTLRHYDKIGLLTPQKSENGYRLYSEEDLEELQVILFYKYLGFSLRKIADLLAEPFVDRLSHLKEQLYLLQQEKKHLDHLILTLQNTIREEQGEISMTISEKFQGFTYEEHRFYQERAVEEYGQEVMDRAQQKQTGREQVMMQHFNQIFKEAALFVKEDMKIETTESQELVGRLFQAINTYGFDCSLEIFGFIGKGYVENPEFQKNIDRFGVGTAQYLSDAIQYYVSQL